VPAVKAPTLVLTRTRLALALVVGIAVASRMPPAPIRAQAVDRYQRTLQPWIEQLLQRERRPGLAIAVVEGNRVVYAHGFGVKRLGKDDPITTRSLFHMASITKTFVATSLMQLVEKGSVDLDAPVVQYLPYFRLADERYPTITVRQMVTHSSGMPDVDDYEWDKPQYDDGSLERYVRGLSDRTLLFAPGEKFRYSNMAFEILGDVIGKVSGQSFDDYVQDHILTPLRMTDSTLLVGRADAQLLTWGHELDANGPFASKVFPYNRMHSPSSNLHSNALDMARWAIANMNHGELDGRRILQTSTHELMWKRARDLGGPAPAPTSRSPVGISWFLGEYRGTVMVGHSGGDTGYATDLAMLPEKKIAVVWMMNSDWRGSRGLTPAALDVALGLEPQPIQP
jgi:CubicO group peptidase (beta-lactamase class C family)